VSSPDRHLPRWARLVGWWVCFATYALAGCVALGDMTAPSATVTATVPHTQVVVTAWIVAAMSVLGLIGVTLHRWRMEWVAASVLVFMLTPRALLVWWSVEDVPSRLAAAAMMTLGAIGAGRRALDLWVFHVNTAAVARRHTRLMARRRALERNR